MQSPLPRSNSSTPQLTPTEASRSNASSRTAVPPATTTEFTADECEFNTVGQSQLDAHVVRADVEFVTTLALNLPAKPDRSRQTFDEIKQSKTVRINQSTVNDVGGHQVKIRLGSNSTSRPGIVPNSPILNNPPAYPADPSTRRVEYTLSSFSKVNNEQIVIQSNDDKAG